MANEPNPPAATAGEDADKTRRALELVEEQLRAKIASKFQASIFLAGLSSALLGIQLNILLTPASAELPAASIIAMSAALALLIYGALRLDALLMPRMFWGKDPYLGQDPKKGDPVELRSIPVESEHLQTLWERMVQHWLFLIGGGSVLVVISLLVTVLPVIETRYGAPLHTITRLVSSSAGTVVSVVIPILYTCWFWLRRDRVSLGKD